MPASGRRRFRVFPMRPSGITNRSAREAQKKDTFLAEKMSRINSASEYGQSFLTTDAEPSHLAITLGALTCMWRMYVPHFFYFPHPNNLVPICVLGIQLAVYCFFSLL